jgi:hypothetical protein
MPSIKFEMADGRLLRPVTILMRRLFGELELFASATGALR